MMARRRFTRAPLGYSAGTRAHTSIRRAYTPSPRRSYLDHDDAYVSRPTPHFYDPSPEYLMADNLANRTIENTTYAAYDADDLYKRSRGKDRQLLSNINYAVANATPGVTSARASVSRRAVRVSTPAPALQSSPSTVLSQTLDRSEVSRPRASVPYMYSRRVVAPIFDVAPVNDSTALLPYYSSPLLRRAVGARAQAGLKRDIRAQSAAPSFAHSPVTAAELSPYYNLGGAVAKLPTEGLRASRKPLPSSMYTYAPRSYLGPSRPIAWDMEPSRTRSPSQMYVRYMSPVRHAISIDHPLKTRASIPYAKATHPGKYNYPSASYIVQKARKGVMAPPEDYSAAGIRHEIGLSGRHVYTVPYTSVYGEKMRSLPRQRAAATRAKSEAKAYSPLEAMMYRPSYSLRKSRRGPRYAVIDYSSGNAEAAVIAPHVEINRRHKEPRSRFAQDKIRSIRLEPKDDYGTPAPERFTGGLHSSAATPQFQMTRYRRY